MADAFPVSGNIDSTSFPHLLVDLHRRGATGSLKVNGPTHAKALYFRGGRILFGSSKDPRDQLGAILIEDGKITREQLNEVNGKVGPGNPLAKVLAESGFVNQRELGDSARVKVERILSDVLSWTSGSFEFEDGVVPKGAVDLKLSTSKLLLAAVQKIGDRAFALRHLGGDMTVVLKAAPDAETALNDVRGEVWPLLERLDGERTLQDAVALTRIDEFEAAKTACALLFLGIVVRKDAGASGELDLAEEALSGFGPHTSSDAAPAAPEAVSPIVPSEAAFSLDDSNSLAESAFPTPAPVSGADELGIASDEPVGVAPDEPVGIAPDEPLGVAPEEPTGVAPEEPPAVATAEPTGFSFTQDEQPPEVAPVVLPPVDLPAPPGAAEAPNEPPPLFSAEPPLALPAPSVAAEPPIEAPAPVVEPEVPSFTMGPPAREGVETVPGDRETVVPEAEPGPEIPIAPPSPEPSDTAPPPAGAAAPATPDSSGRPTQEDLAALDALLDPSASGTKAPQAERPTAEGWEPHFPSSSPSATMGPNATTRRAIGRRSQPSRAPLFAVLATVVVVGLATGYYLLRPSPDADPEPTSTPPEAAPTPALSAPVTVAAAPAPAVSPTAAPTVAPTAPAAGTTATPPPATTATPTPEPPPDATPTPAPPATQAGAPAGDALALLRQGSFDESASAFASELASAAPDSYSIQVLAACSPDTIRKAAQNVTEDDIFILPVTLNGRACYRVGWGLYDSRASAEAGANDLPAYFRQPGIKPRIQPLVELLP
jgi:septal ring-binding cell division protein DamX